MSIGDCGRYMRQCKMGNSSIDDVADAQWEGWPVDKVHKTASAQYALSFIAISDATANRDAASSRLLQALGVFAGLFGVEAGAIFLCSDKPAYGISAMIAGAAVTAYSTCKVMKW